MTMVDRANDLALPNAASRIGFSRNAMNRNARDEFVVAYVPAVIEESGRIVCECGRFLQELSDPGLIAILRQYRVQFFLPDCKACRRRPVIDFAVR